MNSISIIVTIYNKLIYLEKCILSIRALTYPFLEIILVDDGSTDDSGRMADGYAETDERIVVLHKENGGASSARKAGIGVATGDYVLFVDADDWIEPLMAEKMISMLNGSNADVLTAAWVLHDGDTQTVDEGYMPEGLYQKGKSKDYFANHMIYSDGIRNNGINGALCTKIIRRELLASAFERLPEGIVYAEDDFVTYSCLAIGNVIEVTHMPFYHYLMQYNSISHSRIDSFMSDLSRGYWFYIEMIKNLPEYLLYKRQMEIFIQRSLFLGIGKYMGFENTSVISWYQFDSACLQSASSLILYGAGRVGKSYYKQLMKDSGYKLVAWVDKEYAAYQREGYPVESPEIIRKKSADWIVIAVDDEEKAKDISAQIEKSYGFPSKQILWRKPLNILDGILEGELLIHGKESGF